MKNEKLKSLHIDVENGIYEVNGRDISNSGTYMNLVFENGEWSLMVSENSFYSTGDEDIKDNFHLNCGAKLPESTKPVTYVTERVVNISDLEKYIEQAHLSTVSLICGIREGKILSTSDVEDGLEKIDEVLKKAYHFDFCVERRTAICH